MAKAGQQMNGQSDKSALQSMQLPSVAVSDAVSTGRIIHVLQQARELRVLGTQDYKISPRRSDSLYSLEGGVGVLVTSRTDVRQRPPATDGIIFITADGTRKWAAHKDVDEQRERAKSDGWDAVRREIAASWQGHFRFDREFVDASGATVRSGLRPPQIGALHAIGSHWSLSKAPATVVMPTGTGKTETMLATLVAYDPGVLLVVVPSDILREQIARKFSTLGLLRSLGNLSPNVRNPIVGILKRRPKTVADLELFGRCNVVVTTMSAIADGSAAALGPEIAARTGALVVDEAHHIAADGWSQFRAHFGDRHVIQFTATPYRRDGKLVDGKVIYDYPLRMAQQDGYFKHLTFRPVYELDTEDGDEAIADAAVECLRNDLKAGRDHIMMARCDRIARAQQILKLYEDKAPELGPILVHSEVKNKSHLIQQMRSRASRIVVAVDMLGEGFDLPQLKIAAVHDTHKSLAVLLQFTGRFTRTAGAKIGDATVIANIADQNVSAALERLYSEDADWNYLLSEFSSQAAKSHAALIEFLNQSTRLDETVEEDAIEVSNQLLRPNLSTLIYRAETFNPKNFFEALSSGTNVHGVWLHEESNTLYFVTRVEERPRWTRARQLRDRRWDLFVLHFDSKQNLLFLCSSDKTSTYQPLAEAVGATKLLSGDMIFRSLGHINRLVFQNVGVKKHGRRNLRFALYTGSDVADALSLAEKAGSVKSNVSGIGWENGEQVAVGCSYKGRVWTRDPGSIPEFVEWSEAVGRKVLDESIQTDQIIANVLIPTEVETLPDKQVLSTEWPLEILQQSEERVVLEQGGVELPISLFDLDYVRADLSQSRIDFQVMSARGDVWCELSLKIGGDRGYEVTASGGAPVTIRIGNQSSGLAHFLSDYPPLVRFVDLTELDGNIMLEPKSGALEEFPSDRFEVWDWTGTDITKESLWKGGERRDSIQWRVARHYMTGGFDVVFDDDAAGEAGDLVCLKEEPDHIRLAIVHCKFTSGKQAGERIKDVQEVCAQAVRSSKWKGQFRDLCKHVIAREKRLATGERPTRFLRGDVGEVNRIGKASRFKEIRLEVVIAQPGLSQADHTSDQATVLGAAASYLKQTVGIELDVVSSA